MKKVCIQCNKAALVSDETEAHSFPALLFFRLVSTHPLVLSTDLGCVSHELQPGLAPATVLQIAEDTVKMVHYFCKRESGRNKQLERQGDFLSARPATLDFVRTSISKAVRPQVGWA